jgi:hypothetical protein
MNNDELRRAIQEGRAEMPVCPTCGEAVTTWTIDRDLREMEVLAPLWEPQYDGDTTGPLVPTGETKLRSFGTTITTGCGHVIPTDRFVITVRPA